MEVAYTIRFTPDSSTVDYAYDIIVVPCPGVETKPSVVFDVMTAEWRGSEREGEEDSST